jgi:LPS sulfotransferase NodH
MKYLIMSSPRTGSSLLGGALTNSGHAGRPLEFAHKKTLRENGNPEQTIGGLLAYLDRIVEHNTTPNGVFGIKMHFNQFHNLFGEGRHGIKNGIDFMRGFQKFILIFREDKILQAISEMLAMDTGVWNTSDRDYARSVGRELESQDVPLIAKIMARQISEEYSWRNLLMQLNLSFHEVSYENLTASADVELARICSYLAIDGLNDLSLQQKTIKLTDIDATQEMKKEYLRAIGAIKLESDSFSASR